MRHYRPLLAAAILAASTALAMPLTTLATSYPPDNVSGVEVHATTYVGDFVGRAAGPLPGYWYATVQHEALTQPPATPAKITGGAFDLLTWRSGRGALVTGQFVDGGAVTQLNAGLGCTNQTYNVSGSLDHVGIYGQADDGTGTFSALLTHYRTAVFGPCTTYFATIVGTVTLSF